MHYILYNLILLYPYLVCFAFVVRHHAAARGPNHMSRSVHTVREFFLFKIIATVRYKRGTGEGGTRRRLDKNALCILKVCEVCIKLLVIYRKAAVYHVFDSRADEFRSSSYGESVRGSFTVKSYVVYGYAVI